MFIAARRASSPNIAFSVAACADSMVTAPDKSPLLKPSAASRSAFEHSVSDSSPNVP